MKPGLLDPSATRAPRKRARHDPVKCRPGRFQMLLGLGDVELGDRTDTIETGVVEVCLADVYPLRVSRIQWGVGLVVECRASQKLQPQGAGGFHMVTGYASCILVALFGDSFNQRGMLV